MNDEFAVVADSIKKDFLLPHEKTNTLKSSFTNLFKPAGKKEMQHALRGISFEVKKGEFFGIVGRNGSGKSTMLKILASIYQPTDGAIQVNGRLVPFIELGVGFNGELTGRQNVYLNGALLGFSRREMSAMYSDIVAFAELERFMDQKLKNYSSGMQVRLAFSVAIQAQADILLLDEVLAVGDAAFQRKCFDYFMQLKRNKQTVILVTHDMAAVRQYCDKAIMIEKGKVVEKGSPEKVAQAYQKLFVDEAELRQETNQPQDIKSKDRWGDGKVIAKQSIVDVKKDSVTIGCRYEAKAAVPAPIFGFSVYNPAGINMLESSTLKLKYKTKDMKKGDIVTLKWKVPNIFANGNYDISFACCDQSTTLFYDWLNHAASFSINKDYETSGITDPIIAVKEGD
jgi:ABC-2 type transport system ATP-binding protein